MTEDLATPQAPSACPFIAFEDDRDHRSDAPDFRHRCFAAAEPEPRAFPNQERYCLTSGFTACPIFLEWARQEAAGVNKASGAKGAAVAVGAAVGAAAEADAETEDDDTAPAFLAGRRTGTATELPSSRAADASASLWSTEGNGKSRLPIAPPPPNSMAAPAVAQARRGPKHPGWENPPRLENFPRLRSRDERSSNQPLLLALVVVAVVMVGLVLYPLVVVPGGSAKASPTPPPQVSQSVVPSGSAPASIVSTGSGVCAVTYAVKQNETMLNIAVKFHLKMWELYWANHEKIPDPNYIWVGQKLCIPPAGLLTPPPSMDINNPVP